MNVSPAIKTLWYVLVLYTGLACSKQQSAFVNYYPPEIRMYDKAPPQLVDGNLYTEITVPDMTADSVIQWYKAHGFNVGQVSSGYQGSKGKEGVRFFLTHNNDMLLLRLWLYEDK